MANKAWNATDFADGDVIPSTEMIKHSQAHGTFGATGRCATVVIAANDSSALDKAQADYVCIGAADQVVVQSAINDLPSAGGKIVQLAGTLHWNGAPTWKSNVVYEGQGIGSIIQLDADITPFLISNMLDTTFSSFLVKAHSSQTVPLVKLFASTTTIARNRFHDINLNSTAAQAFTAIQLLADGAGIWDNWFSDCTVERCGNVVELRTDSIGSFVNLNYFKNFSVNDFIIGIDVIDVAGYGSNSNQFRDWGCECGSRTTHGLRVPDSIIEHNGNQTLIGVDFIDMMHSPGGQYFYIGTNVRGTLIMAGTVAYDQTMYTDNGLCTQIIERQRVNLSNLYNGEVIIVKADNSGDYTKLSTALAAIWDATSSKRYTVLVMGVITEDTVMDAVSYVDVIGLNAVIECTSDIVDAVTFAYTSNCKWSNLTIKATGTRSGGHNNVISITGTCDDTVILEDITALNETTAGMGIGIEIYNATPRLYNCVAQGGGASAHAGFNIAADATLIGCRGIAADLSDSIGILVSSASPHLVSCSGESGLATGSMAFKFENGAAPIVEHCLNFLKTLWNRKDYTVADNGRFRPFSGHPYQLIMTQLRVVNANVGVTLDIGTSIGGSQIASGVDIGSTGYVFFDFDRAEIAADGYIYLTPSAGIADGDIYLIYTTIYNYANNTGVVFDTHGAAMLNNCNILANGASDAVVIAGSSITHRNWEISNCVLETYDPSNQYAVSAVGTVSDAKIRSSTLIGGYSFIEVIGDAKAKHVDMFMDVLAASATHVRTGEDLSAALPITFTIDAQTDVPRLLSGAFATHANITAYTIDITGVDAKGNTITETKTDADGWSWWTYNAFSTITSIIMSARTGTGASDTMNIGIAEVLGLSNAIYATGDIYKIKKNNANAVIDVAKINTEFGTYNLNVLGLSAGDDFTIWYKSDSNNIS